MTQYLGAFTKGGKTEKNQTTQPFSDNKAHKRAFSLRPAYMKEITKRIVRGELKNSITYESYENDYPELHTKINNTQSENHEYVIQDSALLKHTPFEQIIIDRFKPFYNSKKQT